VLFIPQLLVGEVKPKKKEKKREADDCNGRFRFPREERTQELSAQVLQLLLDGIELGRATPGVIHPRHDAR
jgi:hypothetical protein